MFWFHILYSQLYFIASLKRFCYILDQKGFMSLPGSLNCIYYIISIWKCSLRSKEQKIYFPTNLEFKSHFYIDDNLYWVLRLNFGVRNQVRLRTCYDPCSNHIFQKQVRCKWKTGKKNHLYRTRKIYSI